MAGDVDDSTINIVVVIIIIIIIIPGRSSPHKFRHICGILPANTSTVVLVGNVAFECILPVAPERIWK